MTKQTGAHSLDASTRDISTLLLNDAGAYIVPPSHVFFGTTAEERAIFGHTHGMYCLPTMELVEWLRGFINGRRALEIGAGTGVLCKALDIPGVDNHMQRWPDVKMAYELSGQPIIPYGEHVADGDANAAVENERPDVVIGAWITHRYNATAHHLGGNMYGPDLPALLDHCAELVLICHDAVHANNPMLRHEHTRHTPPWLYSRALSRGDNFIAVFRKK